MLHALREWILNFLAPGWDSPKPELKSYYDFKTGTIKLDMDSFRNSKVVRAQIEACSLQDKTSTSTHAKSRRNDRRRRRAKSSRRECPTTMHDL